MPSQQALDHFTLVFHQRAVALLKEDVRLIGQARATLDRWRQQRGATASDAYFEEWRHLLDQGPDAVERGVCADTDHAAALRNVSPLGFVLPAAERSVLRQTSKARHAA